MSESPLLDALKAGTLAPPAAGAAPPAAAPAAAPAVAPAAPAPGAGLPPEVMAALANPPHGWTAPQVLEYYTQHRQLPQVAPVVAPVAAAPAPAQAPAPAAAPPAAPVTGPHAVPGVPGAATVAAPAEQPAAGPKPRASAANEAKLIIGCATGGLPVSIAEDYLDLLGQRAAAK